MSPYKQNIQWKLKILMFVFIMYNIFKRHEYGIQQEYVMNYQLVNIKKTIVYIHHHCLRSEVK